LRRRQLQRFDAIEKVFEHFQLRPLQGIAQEFRELAELQGGGLVSALAILLADRLDGTDINALGNSHRSKLAIPLEMALAPFRPLGPVPALRLYLIIVIHYIKRW